MVVSKLEAWDGVLERSLPAHLAAALQTQHVSSICQVELPNKKVTTIAEDDKDDDIKLFGSDKEDNKEATQLREERLQQYVEKKAKKLKLVGKSSILLDFKLWDNESDVAQLEASLSSIQLEGLTWGCSKLVHVGYGIC